MVTSEGGVHGLFFFWHTTPVFAWTDFRKQWKPLIRRANDHTNIQKYKLEVSVLCWVHRYWKTPRSV